MNKREAIRAMCDGKKVRREAWGVGEFLKMDENGQIFDEVNLAEDINGYYDADDWDIYEEPKPKVTYDEAVAAKVVKIYFPSESGSDSFNTYHRGAGWTDDELTYFDLADRKGYRMEVVE